MGRVKVVLLIALVSLSLISLAFFFWGGRVGYNPAKLVDALPYNVDMQLTGVYFTEVTPEGREWRMEADTLHYYKKTDLMVLDKVKAVFFSGDGPMHIKGDKAYYEKNDQLVRLVGNIKADDVKGRELITREVRYNLSTGLLMAPGYFTFKSPQMDLNGHGLSIDTRTNRITVLSNADVLLKTTEKLL